MYKLSIEKLFFIALLALTCMSCGTDEEVETPKNTEPVVALPFNAQNPPISVPGPLNASDDQRAKEIVEVLRSINGITSYGSYFIVPSNAEISHTPIEGSAMQNANITVYTWIFNNGSQFVTSAYQISEVEGNYNFEIYFDYGDGLFKFLEGRESVPELRNGLMHDYGLEGSSQVQLEYEWAESSTTGLNVKLVNANRRLEVTIAADNSGSARVFIDNIPNADYTWDGAGTRGTYIYYNSNGVVSQSGSWAG